MAWTASTWAGYGSFRGLVDSWKLDPLKVIVADGGAIYDPRRHTLPPPLPSGPEGSVEKQLSQIIDLIQKEVAKSGVPVPCSRLASLITSQFGLLAADWNGKGGFRKFVEALDLGALRFDWSSSGGVVFDPIRHVALTGASVDAASGAVSNWGDDQSLLPLASQIHEVSGVPLLAPKDYQALFRIIEKDLAENPFDLKETGKRVRDRLRDGGHSGSRLDVNWVLRGLLMRGHVFGSGADDAATLALNTANNVRSLCLREQMILDRATDGAIIHWFGCDQSA